MDLENYKNVANYTVASKELPKYVKEVFTLPKYGLAENANDPMSAWHHLKDIVTQRFDFSSLVKKYGKFQIVNIDFNLVLIDNKTKKPIKTWLLNINSDHSLHYSKTQGKEARQQRPHYGFTIQRNNNPDAVATLGSADDSLDLSSSNKQKIVAHLYLPPNSKNPDHFRMKMDHKSTAEKVTPCCGHALRPRTIVFMPERIIPLEDKRHRSTRTMRITASCETHHKTFNGPVMNWTQERITHDAGHGKGFWAGVGAVAGVVLGVVGVVVGAVVFSFWQDDDDNDD